MQRSLAKTDKHESIHAYRLDIQQLLIKFTTTRVAGRSPAKGFILLFAVGFKANWCKTEEKDSGAKRRYPFLRFLIQAMVAIHLGIENRQDCVAMCEMDYCRYAQPKLAYSDIHPNRSVAQTW